MEYMINTNKVIWRVINDETLILDLDSGHYYTLNKTGTRLWSLLEQGKDERGIVDHFIKRYQIQKEIAQKDIHAVIRSLKKESLISAKKKIA